MIDTETLYYGDMPKDREITKSRTAEYTYTFSGWTPEVSEVTGDITYKAEFNKTKNSYLILFINTGGIVLANPILEYGVMPEYTGEIPPLHTTEYTYTFSGWEPELTRVTQEAAYNAVYTQTKNQYEVIFKNWDGTVIQS
ncbi:MAG: hypothetical protein K6E76_00845 [Patescibacteria group bacterium]|nr:hypothetical protein [Patescibacteria group bacterium]